MKLFSAIKLWMPLVGLGAFLAFAPQSRAQADVSPDHFDENGISRDFAPVKTLAKSALQASSGAAKSTLAVNQKSNSSTKPQSVSAKSSATQQNPLVAVNDKSKISPRKRENQ